MDIYDENLNYVARVSWDCPWGSKQNAYSVEPKSNRYITQLDTHNLYGGTIGTRTVTIANNYDNEDVMKELMEKWRKKSEHWQTRSTYNF